MNSPDPDLVKLNEPNRRRAKRFRPPKRATLSFILWPALAHAPLPSLSTPNSALHSLCHLQAPTMALHISISTPPFRRPASSSLASPTKLPMLAPLPEQLATRGCCRVSQTRRVGMRVRANLEVAGAAVGQVTEVNKDTFWPIVKAAGEKVVVLDMYTQW